jgi:ketosteroid isomerase-like protein
MALCQIWFGGVFCAFLAGDRKALEEILSDDFTFTSPRDDHINKAQYFERCFPHGEQFQSHRIEQICEAGDEAFARYLAELRDGTKFRNIEYFRIEGSKIKEIAVYFGASVSEVG